MFETILKYPKNRNICGIFKLIKKIFKFYDINSIKHNESESLNKTYFNLSDFPHGGISVK